MKWSNGPAAAGAPRAESTMLSARRLPEQGRAAELARGWRIELLGGLQAVAGGTVVTRFRTQAPARGVRIETRRHCRPRVKRCGASAATEEEEMKQSQLETGKRGAERASGAPRRPYRCFATLRASVVLMALAVPVLA